MNTEHRLYSNGPAPISQNYSSPQKPDTNEFQPYLPDIGKEI